jgi:putative ABC transport system permease protein
MLLGRQLAQVMSRTRTFLDLGVFDRPGRIHDHRLHADLLGYALVGVALTLVGPAAPGAAVSRHSIVTLRWEQARSLQPPLWQRYFLDLMLLVPPLYGWYQLSRQGSLALGSGGSDPFANPLLFLVPVLFCFSLALLFLRFFPLLSAPAGLAGRPLAPGTTLLLTLRQLARSPNQYVGPLLLLSLTVSLATFGARWRSPWTITWPTRSTTRSAPT